MTKQRQILHLISSLDGYGESRQLRQLVDRQLADGSRVRILAFSANGRDRTLLEAAGATCRVLEARWQYDPIVAYRLARELRERSHDLLHIWGLAPLGYAKFLRSAGAKVPCVATLAQLPDERLAALPDRIVVPSLQNRRSRKAIAISPGVAASSCDPIPRAEFLEVLSLPADSIVIGIGGQLVQSRSLEEAIWCFELIRTMDERAKLLIFGGGPDRPRLERFSRLASEPEAIRFLGYQEDLDQWLPHFDLFWQIGSEQLPAVPPLTALEAMALGVPVVANDLPAHRQIIDQGRTGFLFPVASRAISARYTMRLLQDAELASSMAGAAGEEVSRKFSLLAFQNAYAELYDQLLSS